MWLASASSVRPEVLRSSSRPSLERRLQARAEIVRRPGQRGDDRCPADDARIDRLDLRHVDPRVDVDLVVGVARR